MLRRKPSDGGERDLREGKQGSLARVGLGDACLQRGTRWHGVSRVGCRAGFSWPPAMDTPAAREFPRGSGGAGVDGLEARGAIELQGTHAAWNGVGGSWVLRNLAEQQHCWGIAAGRIRRREESADERPGRRAVLLGGRAVVIKPLL